MPWQHNCWISANRVVLQITKLKNEKLTCMTFLCMIALQNKKIAHTSLPSSFDNGHCRLCCTFLCIIALKNKKIAHTFLPSFDHGHGRLCHTSPLYWPMADQCAPSNDPTNNCIIFAIHTHCPVTGTKLWEETATARTIQACRVMSVCDFNHHQG